MFVVCCWLSRVYNRPFACAHSTWGTRGTRIVPRRPLRGTGLSLGSASARRTKNQPSTAWQCLSPRQLSAAGKSRMSSDRREWAVGCSLFFSPHPSYPITDNCHPYFPNWQHGNRQLSHCRQSPPCPRRAMAEAVSFSPQRTLGKSKSRMVAGK